jgi:hypothetical protein
MADERPSDLVPVFEDGVALWRALRRHDFASDAKDEVVGPTLGRTRRSFEPVTTDGGVRAEEWF